MQLIKPIPNPLQLSMGLFYPLPTLGVIYAKDSTALEKILKGCKQV
jgi:hypothetical protein